MLRCRRKKNRGFGYYLAANCCGITDFHVLQMATAVAFIFMTRQHLLSLQRWQQHWLPLLKVSQAPGLLWLQFGVIKTINRSQRGSLLLPPHLVAAWAHPPVLVVGIWLGSRRQLRIAPPGSHTLQVWGLVQRWLPIPPLLLCITWS